MFRARFGGSSQPNSNRNGKQGYANAVANGRRNNNNEDVVVDNEATINDGARGVVKDDQKTRALNSKFLFEQRLIMEGKRKHLAKGLILTFLLKKEECNYPFMSKVLRTCGFMPNQVKALKLNEYRTNEAEVLFTVGTVLNINEIQDKLQEASMDVTVSTFEGDEEVFLLEGMPLTEDHENMKKLIKEAVWPFVKNVKDIVATTYYRLEDEFFKGMYDGKYKVTVTPRYGKEVPNFIAVGPQHAAARVVYTKYRSAKKVMCQQCFEVGHTGRDTNLCHGPRTWETYVSEFNEVWQSSARSFSVEENPEMGAEIESVNRAEAAAASQAAGKIQDLEVQIADNNEKVENLMTENAELKEQVAEKDQEIQMLQQGIVNEAVGGNHDRSRSQDLSFSDTDSDSGTIKGNQSEEEQPSTDDWSLVGRKNYRKHGLSPAAAAAAENTKPKKIKIGEKVQETSQLEIDEFYEIQSRRGSIKGWLTRVDVHEEKIHVTRNKKLAGKFLPEETFMFKECTILKRKPSIASLSLK